MLFIFVWSELYTYFLIISFLFDYYLLMNNNEMRWDIFAYAQQILIIHWNENTEYWWQILLYSYNGFFLRQYVNCIKLQRKKRKMRIVHLSLFNILFHLIYGSAQPFYCLVYKLWEGMSKVLRSMTFTCCNYFFFFLVHFAIMYE